MNDLRGPLVPALESLSVDLATGRHGDPHVGFVVFVYPDSPPQIVAVSERGTCPFDKLVTSDSKLASNKPGLFFDHSDLSDADEALGDVRVAMNMFGYSDRGMELGEYIAQETHSRWSNRRESKLKRAMDEAADHARRPATCPKCHQRYTERGLKQHIARSWYCGEPGRIRSAAAWGKAMAAAGERGMDLVCSARDYFDGDREQRLAAIRAARQTRRKMGAIA